MSTRTFIGRVSELQTLERLWGSNKAELLILYGRRRVGKTRLLTHWSEPYEEEGSALYWMAEPTSAFDQLRSFSQAVIHFLDPDTPASPEFSYDSWEMAFRELTRAAAEKRIAILIDEVTYLIDTDPDFSGTLQKAWDHILSKANVMIALCGSQMGLMQQELINHTAPFYGRATALIRLPPLPYSALGLFFPNYSIKDRVAIYAIWGGIPAYWERIDQTRSVIDNLQIQLAPSNTWMLDEPRILLQDFISDPNNYVAIMRAISNGHWALGDISKHTGIASGPISKYLSILRETGFVRRMVPISKIGQDTRVGRYVVTDHFMRFYYRFLSAYSTQLARGKTRQVLDRVEENLNHFIHTNIWPELCWEWVSEASDEAHLPAIQDVGAEWTRTTSVDVVAIDREGKNLVIGSADWKSKPALSILDELYKHSNKLVKDLNGSGNWHVHFLLFSGEDWTDAERFQAESQVVSRKGKNWEASGVELISHPDLDANLNLWTTGQFVQAV
ncbi:MAG: ATP-binding protein [Ardenticatenaceae bacterium]|nr:ATP-binding protein [Ardenticatenaceae bacterium]